MAKLDPFTFVIIIVVVFVAFFIAFVLLGKAAGWDIGKLLPKINVTEEEAEGWRFVASLGELPVVDVTSDNQSLTATSVGCSLASDVYNDFKTYGNVEHGDSLPITNLRLIGWQVWQVPWHRDRGRPLASADLTGEQKNKLAAAGCVECGPYLDEVCITANLVNKKIIGQPFCSEWAKFLGGKLTETAFGNSECDQSLGGGPWGSDRLGSPLAGKTCSGLCNSQAWIEEWSSRRGREDPWANNRIKNWLADSSGNAFFTGDENLLLNIHPPVGQESPLYVYLLLWNPKEKDKFYEIDIQRIPRLEHKSILIDRLPADLISKTGGKRASPAGAIVGELRRVADLNYTIDGETDFDDFLPDLNGTGAITAVTECEIFPECLESDLTNLTQYKRLKLVGNKTARDWVFTPEGEWLGETTFLDRYNLITNLKSGDTVSGEARVIIDNWNPAGDEKSAIGFACIDRKSNALAGAKVIASDDIKRFSDSLVGLAIKIGASPAFGTLGEFIDIYNGKSSGETLEALKNLIIQLTSCDFDKHFLYLLESEQEGAVARNIVLWSGPTGELVAD